MTSLTTPGNDELPVQEAPTGPERMSRWLWVVYPLALIAMGAVWGGVMQVLLGKQIATIIPDAAASATALGVAMSVGAISSVISQPVMGRLSDRTPGRFLGRRNSWVLGASIAGAIGLLVMSQLTSTTALAITWAVVMWPLNGTQAALTAVMPERVPVRFRGSMSGLVGAASSVGMYIGVAIAGLSEDLFLGYLGVAAVFVLICALFALSTKDYAPPAITATSASALREAARFPGFRTAPDYWFTFVGRFLLVFGYFSVASFQLYILRDYIGLDDIDAASTALVALTGLSTVLSVTFALFGGWLSDRLGRLRLFVAISTLLFLPAGLVYLLVPTMTGAWIATAFTGSAFGIYSAVDQALITRVLPNVHNAARDLGVMNIANAGPQIIAPSVAGLVVGATGDYRVVFIALIVCTILGAISVRFIKGVR
ncbi:MAG TPA: MFS transporter [Cellulomonas sp.]